jgi:CMP-N-acetylneuraminic acid synthetase
MTRVVAIVPMRHDSERVPSKNYRELGGRPLFHHVLETLLDSPRIDETVIDTDSETISEDAARAFPTVTVLDRPSHLRGGLVSMNDVLLNDVQRVPADLYLQTHSTNPFLHTESVTRAIDEFLVAVANGDADEPPPDSLFSVTRLQTRLWNADATPLNHDPRVLIRTQDLPPVYEENSCLYLFTRESLETHGSRIGRRPMLFELPREEALDIDEEADFELAQARLQQQAHR